MKLRKINTKGQVGGLQASILAIVVATIVLVIGFIMVQEIRDIPSLKSAVTTTVTLQNISGPVSTTTGINVPEIGVPGASFTLLGAQNISDFSQPFGLGNYSMNSNGTLTLTSAGVTNNVSNGDLGVNINYSYSHGDTAFIKANDSLTGLGSFADFWTLIVLAIVVGVVLTIILSTFGGGTGRR